MCFSRRVPLAISLVCLVTASLAAGTANGAEPSAEASAFAAPAMWEYGPPLISAEPREEHRSHAQKDPTIVFHDGKWHVFMTIKVGRRTIMEHCSFADWNDANASKRTVLEVAEGDYWCAPQVFWFEPHAKWYLVYQVGVPGQNKMMVAYSTTTDIDDPLSWTRAQPILGGGPDDPRVEGGIDYWIVCDDEHAYLFFTANNGKMWRMRTKLANFPRGFGELAIALEGPIFEASHTYRLKGRENEKGQWLTIIEEDGRRYYKAYVADALDGEWKPVADTEEHPFAGAANVRPAPGVDAWTDNVSHGELVRDGVDQTMTVDPAKLQFVFQGMFERDKAGKNYGQWGWRIGILTPASKEAPRP